MALTCCLNQKCDRTYGEYLPACPHCGTRNFFSDADPVVLTAAVGVLVEQMHAEDRGTKLREIAALRPPRPPRWYHHAARRSVRWVGSTVNALVHSVIWHYVQKRLP